MGSYHSFSHILLLSRPFFFLSYFLTSVFCNCHPHGYASFDSEKNQIGRFLAWGCVKNVLPLKSRNKKFQIFISAILIYS